MCLEIPHFIFLIFYFRAKNLKQIKLCGVNVQYVMVLASNFLMIFVLIFILTISLYARFLEYANVADRTRPYLQEHATILMEEDALPVLQATKWS